MKNSSVLFTCDRTKPKSHNIETDTQKKIQLNVEDSANKTGMMDYCCDSI
jgi:hypothetical protein